MPEIAEAAPAADHSSRSIRERFLAGLSRLPVFLSIFAALHFAVSLAVWGVGTWEYFLDFRPNLANGFRAYLFWHTFPAVVLFALSVACLVRAWRRKRFALASIAAVYLLSGIAFAYDMANQRAQVEIGIATFEYWDQGKPARIYWTWWWFNGPWFNDRLFY
jgi:hypothetical protein